MAKNYYVVLGVEPNATPEQIKSAYRERVKELHPDYYGEDCEPFLAVQEAYQVLSDPARRRSHDRKLARRQAPRGRPFRRGPVEPLIPHEQPFGSRAGSRRAKVEAGRWLEVAVPLSAAQASQGGRVRLWLPVETGCPTCLGEGGVAFYECPHCGGLGTIAEQYPLIVAFPAGITDGYTARLSLEQLGLEGTDLLVRFRVGG